MAKIKTNIDYLVNDLDSELKFLNLLGLSLMETDKAGKYLIMDDNKKVGIIREEKHYSKSSKGGLTIALGYYMEIESDKVSYTGYRTFNKINDGKGKCFADYNYMYSFDVKDNGIKIGKATVFLNENPKISYHSKISDDVLDFYLIKNKLYLRMLRDCGRFINDDLVIVELDSKRNELMRDYDKMYSYTNGVYAKNNMDEIIISDYECVHKSNWIDRGDPYMMIQSQTVKNWNIEEKKTKKVITNTIEDVILSHQKGIDIFKLFRFIINQFLPFKEDIFSCLMENCEYRDKEYLLFIPELDKKKDNVKKLK